LPAEEGLEQGFGLDCRSHEEKCFSECCGELDLSQFHRYRACTRMTASGLFEGFWSLHGCSSAVPGPDCSSFRSLSFERPDYSSLELALGLQTVRILASCLAQAISCGGRKLLLQ